jgi:hypothetical protein
MTGSDIENINSDINCLLIKAVYFLPCAMLKSITMPTMSVATPPMLNTIPRPGASEVANSKPAAISTALIRIVKTGTITASVLSIPLIPLSNYLAGDIYRLSLPDIH